VVKKKYPQRKAYIKEIAGRRIENLYQLADEQMNSDPVLAQKYATLARNIALRMNVKIPERYSKRICIHCKQLLRPGINCRVRIRSKPTPHVAIFCKNCRKFMRKNLKYKKVTGNVTKENPFHEGKN